MRGGADAAAADAGVDRSRRSATRVWAFAEQATGPAVHGGRDERARPRETAGCHAAVRLVLARVVVAVGIVVALIALVTARYGFLFVAIIVIGLGAAMGPGRRRKG